MHELGLLTAVVKAVEKTAVARGATRVEAVGLKVGSMSGAEPEALVGAWPMATAGTMVEGAELLIDWVVAAVWCPTCQANQEIDEYFALTCPVCGTPTGHLVGGREFEVSFADLDHSNS